MSLLDLVNLVVTWSFPKPGDSIPTWASPGPGESGPIWVSPSSGDFVPHLDLIAVNYFLASPGHDDAGSPLGLSLTW